MKIERSPQTLEPKIYKNVKGQSAMPIMHTHFTHFLVCILLIQLFKFTFVDRKSVV